MRTLHLEFLPQNVLTNVLTPIYASIGVFSHDFNNTVTVIAEIHLVITFFMLTLIYLQWRCCYFARRAYIIDGEPMAPVLKAAR